MKDSKIKGKLLLAEPFMMDPNFKRSVVLVCEDHQEGSVGFILNKTIDADLNELMEDFPLWTGKVYFGGPVDTNTIHFLHNVNDLVPDGFQVSKNLYWGGDFERLQFLIANKMVTPDNVRFFVGYSGWSPGQLKTELTTGSWFESTSRYKKLLKIPSKNLWSKVMHSKGNTFSVISQLPDFYSMN